MTKKQSDTIYVLQLIRSLKIVNNQELINDILNVLIQPKVAPVIVSWVNAHIFNLSRANKGLADNLMAATYLFRDGIGMSVFLRLIGISPGQNMNGTDFIPKIIRRFSGKRIAIFGTCEPYLSKAAREIEKLGSTIVVRDDGFKAPEVYLDYLVAHPADLIILGMGTPKQENVAAFLASKLLAPAVIVNGGAILDFMGQRFQRAPLIWRRMRLEWLFRLIQEPRRLLKRYTIGGFIFATYAIRLFLLKRKQRLLCT